MVEPAKAVAKDVVARAKKSAANADASAEEQKKPRQVKQKSTTTATATAATSSSNSSASASGTAPKALSKMRKADLVAECEKRGIDSTGTVRVCAMNAPCT